MATITLHTYHWHCHEQLLQVINKLLWVPANDGPVGKHQFWSINCSYLNCRIYIHTRNMVLQHTNTQKVTILYISEQKFWKGAFSSAHVVSWRPKMVTTCYQEYYSCSYQMPYKNLKDENPPIQNPNKCNSCWCYHSHDDLLINHGRVLWKRVSMETNANLTSARPENLV